MVPKYSLFLVLLLCINIDSSKCRVWDLYPEDGLDSSSKLRSNSDEAWKSSSSQTDENDIHSRSSSEQAHSSSSEFSSSSSDSEDSSESNSAHSSRCQFPKVDKWKNASNCKWRAVHDGVYHSTSSRPNGRREVFVCRVGGPTSTLKLSRRPCTDGQEVAHAVLKNAVNQTGWAYLDVATNNSHSNKMMAYAAGMAEAAVSHDLIDWHKTNTMYTDCVAPSSPAMKTYCAKLDAFLQQNMQWMLGMAEKEKADPYWQHVKLVFYQLTGMEDVYTTISYEEHYGADNEKVFEPWIRTNPTFIWFQLGGDLEDLEQALGKPKHLWKRQLGFSHCSALVKPLPGNADLLVAHDTWCQSQTLSGTAPWSPYLNMLRIVKRYNLAFVNKNAPAPGGTIAFSSYPGTLFSIDDFYTTSAKLVVTETTIGNSNASLWRHVTPRSLLTWVRTIVSNRLAGSGEQWMQLFELHNSGTYNNQWMVVDYKRFRPGQPMPQSGLFYVMEQLPGMIEYADLSSVLSQQGYWPSYNSPYFEAIFNASGVRDSERKFGDWFSYERTPRALMFKRDQHTVNDLRSLSALMRYNDYTHDPLSRCEQCSPPFSAENAISARNDLNPKSGSYPFAALGHRSHGGIDMKAVNAAMVDSFNMLAISGPSCDQQPIFNWTTADFGPSTPHAGHPNSWNFPYVYVDWNRQ